MSEGPGRLAGLTLLEVLLVLFVLSLAGIIVFPSLQPLVVRTGAEAAARKAVAFLDDARRQAVQSGRTVEVTLDLPEGLLVVRPESDGEGPAGRLSFPETIEADLPAREPVRYFPQGTSSGGVLILRRGGHEVYRVIISSFTGLARLEEAEEGGL